MRIAVVILEWNKPQTTAHCLRTSKRSTNLPVDWIVVDNGSATPFAFTEHAVKILRSEQNLGFAGGANLGLRHAFDQGADAVWVLNNDAEPEWEALDRLVSVARKPGIGLVSPVIVDLDSNVDWFGSRCDAGVYNDTTDSSEYAAWEISAPEAICLVGTALLVTRRLFERIELFDEGLFAYYEDMDLSRRSSAAGLRNVVVQDSVVKHPASPLDAIKRPPYYYYFMARNRLLVAAKLNDPIRTRYWAIRQIIRWHGVPSLDNTRRNAIRRGLFHGLLGRNGPYNS